MPRKKVDNRIRVLIENGAALRQRSMFVLVGDKGRDQVGARDARSRSRVTPASRFPLSGRRRPAGGDPAPHAVQGEREGEAVRALVLQEGARLQQVSARDAGRMYLAHA